MDLRREVDENTVLLAAIQKDYYNSSLLEILKNLDNKRVCYVVLNNTAYALNGFFRFHDVSTDNILFVDAVSKGIGMEKNKEQENTILISSPAALEELSIVLSKIIEKSKIDVFIFDSLSTLSLYKSDEMNISKFLMTLAKSIRAHGKKAIFTCLEQDIETSLITNFMEHADKKLDLKEIGLMNKKGMMAVAMALAVPVFAFLSFFRIISGKTGFAVSNPFINPDMMMVSILTVAVLVIIAAAGIFIIIKRVFSAGPIHPMELLKIKPAKESKNFKKELGKKTENFLKKRYA